MTEIKTEEALNTLLNSGNVLLKIGSNSCGPCKITEQNIENVKPLFSGIKFVKIDVDECDEELLDDLNIRNIPVVIYYKNGVELLRKAGLQTEGMLKEDLSVL